MECSDNSNSFVASKVPSFERRLHHGESGGKCPRNFNNSVKSKHHPWQDDYNHLEIAWRCSNKSNNFIEAKGLSLERLGKRNRMRIFQ
jgi:hypothetical protein